jgi:hypothetical protein
MYTLEDVYKTFPSGCTEDYKILRAFEMGKQTREKRIAELEAQIEKMKCCYNCSKWYYGECEESPKSKTFFCADFKCDNWEIADD